jgi:hypothetical protein
MYVSFPALPRTGVASMPIAVALSFACFPGVRVLIPPPDPLRICCPPCLWCIAREEPGEQCVYAPRFSTGFRTAIAFQFAAPCCTTSAVPLLLAPFLCSGCVCSCIASFVSVSASTTSSSSFPAVSLPLGSQFLVRLNPIAVSLLLLLLLGALAIVFVFSRVAVRGCGSLTSN